MKGNGYEVVSANNGVQALERLGAESCDMIISDILMPVMDGFKFCREVKRDEALQNIPFVFYTATYTDKKDEEFALALGADKFIRKSMDPDEFVRNPGLKTWGFQMLNRGLCHFVWEFQKNNTPKRKFHRCNVTR